MRYTSTRSNIIIQDRYNRLQLYRHHDGYPDGKQGVLATLEEALHYAWQLPRFEAEDFAAAIVRAWKADGGGNIYIDGNARAWEKVHGDTEWVYVIKGSSEEPTVEVYDWHNYWLDKVNINAKDFRPTAIATFRLSQAKQKGLAWQAPV